MAFHWGREAEHHLPWTSNSKEKQLWRWCLRVVVLHPVGKCHIRLHSATPWSLWGEDSTHVGWLLKKFYVNTNQLQTKQIFLLIKGMLFRISRKCPCIFCKLGRSFCVNSAFLNFIFRNADRPHFSRKGIDTATREIPSLVQRAWFWSFSVFLGKWRQNGHGRINLKFVF